MNYTQFQNNMPIHISADDLTGSVHTGNAVEILFKHAADNQLTNCDVDPTEARNFAHKFGGSDAVMNTEETCKAIKEFDNLNRLCGNYIDVVTQSAGAHHDVVATNAIGHYNLKLVRDAIAAIGAETYAAITKNLRLQPEIEAQEKASQCNMQRVRMMNLF